MSSIVETGHAKNVANFGKLISFCTAYGTTYNPSKSTLSLVALSTLQSESQNALNAVHSAFSEYKTALAIRETTFKPFNKLITRVINALKASESTAELDAKAVSITKKIRGKRVSVKQTNSEVQTELAEGTVQKEYSSSQQSIDNRIDNFSKLVTLLGSVPAYNPNEEELKPASLATCLQDLKSKNDAVINAATALSNSRIARNKLLYNENSGLVDTAMDVKSYVKSVYGADTPQFKQLSGLEFKRMKE